MQIKEIEFSCTNDVLDVGRGELLCASVKMSGDEG